MKKKKQKKKNEDSQVQRVLAALASDSRLLVPPERHIRMQRIYAVDPGRAGVQPVRKGDPARDVLREHRRREPVQRVVRLPQHVLLVLKLDHHAHRPENLLLDDPHVGARVREDRRLDPVSLRSVPFASEVHLCALLFAGVDVAHDALRGFEIFARQKHARRAGETRKEWGGTYRRTDVKLDLGYLRTLVRVAREWVSELDRP